MTNRRQFFLLTALAVFASGAALLAQTPVEPTAYTVAVQFQVSNPKTVRKTYRLGSKVVVEVLADTSAPSGKLGETSQETRTRTLYDLQTKESLSWVDVSRPCERSTFLDDEWQDPFAGARDLSMKNVKHVGRETIHGLTATILESNDHPDSTFRLWVDPETGLMLKAQLVSKKLNATIPYFEVTDVSLTPPPASTFDTPANCVPR